MAMGVVCLNTISVETNWRLWIVLPTLQILFLQGALQPSVPPDLDSKDAVVREHERWRRSLVEVPLLGTK